MTRFTNEENGGPIYKHHCRICQGAVTRRCLRQSHVSYCEECRRIFQTFSKTGCNEHTYSAGYNLSVKKLKSGLPADHRTDMERQQEADIVATRIRRRDAATATAAAEQNLSRKGKKESQKDDERCHHGKKH